MQELGRRGKYLVWNLEDDVHLVQHLRMTGAVLFDPDPEPPHTRVRIELGQGHRLAIVDPRRFGTGELLLGQEALEAFFAARLGLEPLDELFTAEHLRAQARGRTAPVKAFLLDQRRDRRRRQHLRRRGAVPGGHPPAAPRRSGCRGEQYERLRETTIAALRAGIDARGATIDDFRHVDGVSGSFQNQFLVHRREGEPCGTCGTTIVKMVVAGRGTYVCETCQPRPRRKRARA